MVLNIRILLSNQIKEEWKGMCEKRGCEKRGCEKRGFEKRGCEKTEAEMLHVDSHLSSQKETCQEKI
ncbi:MAG: hypothetical protein HXK85_02390 [Lachnospiraceae bacterium]|nr:hypothetical protein [Lachnospiraceae bacterium]